MPNELPPRDEYLPRIVDDKCAATLRFSGRWKWRTKWCGKTWTACRHGESVSYVDDALALANPTLRRCLRASSPTSLMSGNLHRPSGTPFAMPWIASGGARRVAFNGLFHPSRERRGSGESDAQRRRPHRPHSHAPDEPCRIGRLDRSGFPGPRFSAENLRGPPVRGTRPPLPLRRAAVVGPRRWIFPRANLFSPQGST